MRRDKRLSTCLELLWVFSRIFLIFFFFILIIYLSAGTQTGAHRAGTPATGAHRAGTPVTGAHQAGTPATGAHRAGTPADPLPARGGHRRTDHVSKDRGQAGQTGAGQEERGGGGHGCGEQGGGGGGGEYRYTPGQVGSVLCIMCLTTFR